MARGLKSALLASTFLIWAAPAQAEPITMAIASTASAWVTSAAAGAAFTFFGMTGAGAVLASIAAKAALGYALNSLTLKGQKKSSSGSASRGYTVRHGPKPPNGGDGNASLSLCNCHPAAANVANPHVPARGSLSAPERGVGI